LTLNPAVPGQGFSKLQKNSPAVSSTGVIFILPEGVNLIMPEGVSPACPKGSNSRAFSSTFSCLCHGDPSIEQHRQSVFLHFFYE